MSNYLILNTSTILRRRVGLSRCDRRQRPTSDADQQTSSPSKSNKVQKLNTTMRGHISDSDLEDHHFRAPNSDDSDPDSDPERESRVAINPSFLSKAEDEKNSHTKSSARRTRNGAKEQDTSYNDQQPTNCQSSPLASVTKGLKQRRKTRKKLADIKPHGSDQHTNVTKSQSSSQSSTLGSPKRKIEGREEKKDIFGQDSVKRRKAKLTYSKLSNTKAPLKPSSTKQANPDIFPAKKHQTLDEIDSFSSSGEEKVAQVRCLNSLSPLPDTPAPKRKIKVPAVASTPAVKSEEKLSFKALVDGDSDDFLTSPLKNSSRAEDEQFQLTQLPTFNGLDESFMDDFFDLPTKRSPKSEDEQLPLMNRPVFKDLDVNSLGLTEATRAILEEDKDLLSRPLNDDEAPSSQEFRCLMCHHVLGPDDFQKIANMNTRMQEKACETHQKKFAKADWKTNGYPSINWMELDRRIDGHHPFVKKLIRGANCPYRSLLKEKVEKGEDRNAKNSAMITPGYYGGRGRQVISNNIMNGFTPLLSKRTVKDELISARGMTGFVQCVIMPEVAVHLIMEDMNMNEAEARGVLFESASIGELVNPDIKDILKRRIKDSDDEDDY
ncbi:RTC4-like domain-containing protein [Amylocarpus encephaloides]|uniref:Restriction of telomere capping protein 4 n=1 Tax=Amylocarpus encephaloides TaxID=45428 RepID=A0A9P7YSZ3_9HELO|nr:RTC4-like domain-containing protein [Amylocarpus encephaloides]